MPVRKWSTIKRDMGVPDVPMYLVVGERDGNRWFLRIPELGTATEAPRLDDIETMARDLIATWLSVEPDSFNLHVELVFPGAHARPVESASSMLTLAQAAERLGIGASTLRHQAGRGTLRGTLVGKTWVVTQDEVERYRAENLGRRGRPRRER